MERGQFSIEFIIVLAAFFIVLATVSVPLYTNTRETANELTDVTEAREAANELTLILNTVYSGSPGTQQTTTYWLPESASEVRGTSRDNKLQVSITLEFADEDVTVEVSTLIPDEWKDRVFLENIELVENARTYHRTTVALEEDEESYLPRHQIAVSDKILRRE
ncbi:hypothetical protein AKJ65_03410 [candidate division MSBL1 archaeon SCGC-AAA259E19]|uniref:Uncharacterized protein n=2 Tax=candidate division MSBL1 TaxID=215777 RepID=A0A133V4R5_9EURY|nr:hypothetical protein AKJ65_03410 [candidate division MSBL1 archaeon SCGC-AAA259E19]KXB01439.1 hypothetical protein AKJ41_01470 [candidate division MSBL1 archaeon SCGC-AAA259O05]